MDVARGAFELHGGIGFTWECDLQFWFKRALFDRQLPRHARTCTTTAARGSRAGSPWTSATAPSTRPSAPSCARSSRRRGRCGRRGGAAPPSASTRCSASAPSHAATSTARSRAATAAPSSRATRSATRSCWRSSPRAACPGACPRWGRRWSRRRCSSGAATRRRSASSRRRCATRSAGARATASPAPAATSPRSQSRAELDGDEWVIHGHKVWTSLAGEADWMFGLFRTEPGAAKHAGISYLLVPMKQPGVRVAPLRQMNGGAEFYEVFFDGARTDGREPPRPARRGLEGLALDARARAQADRRPELHPAPVQRRWSSSRGAASAAAGPALEDPGVRRRLSRLEGVPARAGVHEPAPALGEREGRVHEGDDRRCSSPSSTRRT